MIFKSSVVVLWILVLAEAGKIKKTGNKYTKNYSTIRKNSSNFGLWPSSFNLATKAIITTNATCGENGREEFCRMVESGKGRCGICDNYGTDPGKKHQINFAIDGSNRWWQSPALHYGAKYEYVTITIDLKQVYQITDVIIKAANSLRPGTWILERSLNGYDYMPWQYFARNDRECIERFGIPSTKGKPHYFTDSEVICTSFYSKLIPMENGEIHTSLINGRPGANETSPELLEFTKARYVRLRLMGLRGAVEPLPRWFLQDVLREKRLFYTIRDISIIGYCMCNGHAENCRHNVASGHPECECMHHTCGPNCDKCCPMFNQRVWAPASSRDSHQCLPCNCNNHATSCRYDENVDKAGLSMDINGNYQGGGVCDNCTAHTTGINCERCMQGYYRPLSHKIDSEKPCLKCDCQPPGSLGTCIQEGEDAGICQCLPGYEGPKCDQCAKGFRGWPNCEACPCDLRGSEHMPDCEGDCLCKRNVAGKFCDKCKQGFFGLKKGNSEGCLKCFCSGVTTICESALVQPKKIQTLEEWSITDVKISTHAEPIRDDKGLFAIGNYELANTETLYWLAPSAYLGNKLEYYDSFLTFKVHWVIMRGDTSGKPTTGPNIIVLGNKFKLAYGDDSYSTSNETFQIKLKETGWYHYDSLDRPVNRKEFLDVLSNITHILLRATFHTDQIESLLEEATMCSDGSELVEKCFCPSGYSGLSCELCAFGFVRIVTNETTGESFCGKCDCNGHSETCNPDTGECFCQHNTTGENCERCKPGFYGNPLRGTKDDCKKCACPLENDENNFSPSCQLDYLSEGKEGEKGYVCTQCPKGYTGDHCEICDDGFFGNPMIIGNDCKPCNCNGGPCDKLTGKCLSCKGNTEGWKCEKCKSGYYGDALTSNCISCQCDSIGAVSAACNSITGQCECKDRFTGRTCNKCQLGYGNVTASCIPCSCNSTGSKSDICDPYTGLCECKNGVDGFHCDACQNLHYGFSKDGCTECNCDKYGSKIQACDHNTGKCICKPHYEGVKCDRCELSYYKLKNVCTPCNCNLNGSINLHCNPETGICQCKDGVQGEKCDTCQDKHYGNVATGCRVCDLCEKEGHICHPKTGKCVCPSLTTGAKCEKCVLNSWGHEPGIGCKPCGCSSAGSSKLQCDAVSGRCTCKLGFEGEKCDKCSFGYKNYPNCEKCKCNVAGTLPENCDRGICKCSRDGCKCKSNVEGLLCNRCKKGTFGMDANHPDGCIPCFCSNRSKSCSASILKWSRERGDLHKIKKNHWETRSFTGDLMQSYGGILTISTNSSRNFVYLIGNGITLESVTDVRGDIKLNEIFWKSKSKSRLPKECFSELTRSCFMVVLQNVSSIQIEPNSPNFINGVFLDRKTQTVGMLPAKTVENCNCPKEYKSESCEDPNDGYYRFRPTNTNNYIDRILGIAKPCQCNNKSNNCDKETGHCFSCRDFTTGPRCELCAQGFYKDEKGNCSPCLCPSADQNFASNCTVSGANFNCTCKVGYAGSKCDRCDDKFWGNPETPGGSCNSCNCNPHGSENLRCDRNGKCLCKPGFTGDKCSTCTSPRSVIENGICLPCDECTQILFHSLDDLSNQIDGALVLFKNGLGPPWSLLNVTIAHYEILKRRFEKIQSAQKLLNNANIPQIEQTIKNMKENLILKEDNLNNNLKASKDLQNEFQTYLKSVENLNKDINIFLGNINKFGTSHVDVNVALREAKELFNDILAIANETPSIDFYQDFFTKCHNITNQINQLYKDGLNPNQTKSDLLELRNRLMQFNKDIKFAENTTHLVATKNKRNAKRIEKLQNSILELNSSHFLINKNLENYYNKIQTTNMILENLTRIYNNLSKIKIEDASLEQENISEIYDTLSEVRDHVSDLQKKIKTFNNTFKFTREEWEKIDASGSYHSILQGIQLAKKAADDAKSITIEATQKLYPANNDSLLDHANLARAFSDRIEKRVLNLKSLSSDFKITTDKLETLKDSILKNGKSNNELNSFLRDMKDIRVLLSRILNKAEDNAKYVLSLITSIEHNLTDTHIKMQYNLVKSYEKYLKLLSEPEMVNLTKLINETKQQLHNKDLSLNLEAIDKIRDANRTMFNNNETLTRMKNQMTNLNNLIQYANDMVDSVDYGFNLKTCSRYYQLQNDILRTLEINFKCESCFLFNLTNSNNKPIKINYQNGTASILWKNQTFEIAANSSISLKKVGKRIEVVSDIAEQSQNLIDEEPFEIESKYSLQVGDVSEGDACLRKIRINSRTIGLWKFYKSKGSCLACNKYNTNNDGLVNVFFNGNGYREVQKSDISPARFSFQFSFATFDENSLIFLASKKDSFIALNLKNGHLEMTVKHDNSKKLITLTSNKKYNNGRDTKVVLLMNYMRDNQTQNYMLQVVFPSEEKITTSASLPATNVYKIRESKLFVGGVPSTFTKSIPINTTSFLGNMNASEEVKNIYIKNQNSFSANIEPRLDKLEFNKAWFPGNGYLKLEAKHTTFSNLNFVIKCVNMSNYFILNINNQLNVFVKNFYLIFQVNQQEISFPITPNSYIYISLNKTGIQVNGTFKNISLDIFEDNKTTFYLGKNNQSSFVGSLGDFIINDRALTFNPETVKEFNNVEIGRDRILPKSETVAKQKEMQNTERYLYEYRTEPQAFKFGDKPNSFVHIKIGFTKKFLLEFQFRTFYPNGLLFVSNNRTFFIILEIHNGDLRLKVQGHKTKIMNVNQRINDGDWHQIQVEQLLGKKKWRLVIKLDKKWKLKERISRNGFNGDLYLGGAPQVQKKIKTELIPFRGCIRSLKINKNPQVVRNNNNVLYSNIGQCFQNVEEGAYFGGDAYAIYKYAFKVDKFLELSFEFKTVEPNGILLSVSNPGNSPALSVELQNGAVVMTIDMGIGIISQVTNSPHADLSLANNEWHNITALYSSSELTVNVDGVRKSWVQSEINSMMDKIEAPLYVGGLPSNAPSGTLKIKENFKGCIRKFKIEDNIMDWTDMKKLNNVQLNSCLA